MDTIRLRRLMSAKIAVVRIVSKETVRDLSRLDRPVCGQLLTAAVVEPLKGGSGAFTFFSPVVDDFAGTREEYFVMAFPKGEPSPTDDTPPIDSNNQDQMSKQHCLALQPLYVPIQFQSLWRFDSNNSIGESARWLLGANRPDGLLCGFDVRKEVGPRLKLVAGIHVQSRHGAHRYALSWSDVERVVRSNLDRPYSVSHCGIEE